jgi:hypothetical protein
MLLMAIVRLALVELVLLALVLSQKVAEFVLLDDLLTLTGSMALTRLLTLTLFVVPGKL